MADYYTLLTNAGIAYETACKAAGTPIKLTQMSVGDGGVGGVYNPDATATALKREVWRGNLNALFQDPANPSWLLAEVTIPPEVGGWYVREAGLWTDTGILYAVVKYPESFKPVLASSGSGKEFYIRSIFETSNAALVTLSIDDTIVKATRSWVVSYVADELAKLDRKQSVRAATTGNIVLVGPQTIDGVAVVAGDRVLVKNQTAAKDNGVYVAAVGAWARAKDADNNAKVTPNLTVAVEVGATQADTIWQLVTDGLIVVGTTALTFKDITDGFARLFSPSFAGNPTAPTPAQFDASKSIATAEYVKRSGVEFSGFTTNDASSVMTAAHVGGLHSFSGVAQLQATLPPTVGVAQAATITLVCAGNGGLKIVPAAGDVVYTSTGLSGPLVLALGDTAEFIRLENQWRLIGGTAALAFGGVMAGPNFATRPQFDAGKALATTEFVQRALGNFSGQTNITASGTVIAPAMAGRRIVVSVPATLTLSQLGINTVGAKFYLQNSSGGDVVVNRWGTDTIVALSKTLNSITIPTGSFAVLVCGETNWVLEEGVAALKYSTEFAFSHAANGYQKLPSGLIEQWGSVAVTDNAEVNVVLPTAFPNAILGALVSVPLSAQAGAAEFSIAGVRKNGSSLNSILVNANSGPTTSVNPVIFWRVWGN